MLDFLVIFGLGVVSTFIVCGMISVNRKGICPNCKEDLNYKNHNCPYCGIDKEYFKRR